MREARVDRFATVLRLALLSIVAAAGWLILSFAVSAAGAFAQESSSLLAPDSPGSSQETTSPARGILHTATKPLAPVADAVDRAVPAPGALIADTPVGTVVDEFVGTLNNLTGALDDLAGEAIGLVSRTVADVLPSDDLEELLENILDDAVDGLVQGGTDLIPIGHTGNHSAHAVYAATTTGHLVSEALSPLSQGPRPWVPGELVLVSSGALSPSGAGGAAPAASDLPLIDKPFDAGLTRAARPANDDIPGSPTFDTDCTPD